MTVHLSHIEFYSGFLINKLERQRNKILLQSFDKTLRKQGKTKQTRSRELNTFMVAHGHLRLDLFEDSESRKQLESKLKAVYHKKYLSRIKRNRRNALKKDLELKASKTALLRAHRHLPETEALEVKKLVEIRFEEFLKDLNDRFDEMNEKTIFTLWDLPGVEEDRLVLYNQIIPRPPSVGEEYEDIGELVDEMALVIFGYRFLRNLKAVLESPLALAESAVQILNYYRSIVSDPSPTYQHKEDFTNVLRVLLGKVLGLRDILKVCKREVTRFETVLDELDIEAAQLNTRGISEIAREYIDP
ncbi:MAG: hypothetical protein ACFFCQ_16915, partial [Promethearchaeota archaeon]